MKKTLRYISLVAVAAMLGLVGGSCTFESSDNGDLDGFWHMVSVDTLSTGTTCDLSEQTVFWAVQHKLLYLRDYRHASFITRFRQTADSLRVYEIYYYDRAQGDPAVTDASVLAPYGLDSLDNGFAIEQLSGSNMSLRSRRLRLHFVKH